MYLLQSTSEYHEQHAVWCCVSIVLCAKEDGALLKMTQIRISSGQDFQYLNIFGYKVNSLSFFKPQVFFFCCFFLRKSSFCYIPFGKWSADDEVRSLTVREMKLLCSQVLWQQTPGGSDCCWVGVVFMYPLGSVQADHFTDITDALYLEPVMFWLVLITSCRTLLRWAVHQPCLVQFVMLPDRVLSISPLIKVDQNPALDFSLLSLSSKSSLFCAFLTRVVMSDDH